MERCCESIQKKWTLEPKTEEKLECCIIIGVLILLLTL